MMSNVVKKLIGEITGLAFEVTNKTKHDVFIHYSGHVNSFTVTYHENGYYSGNPEITLLNVFMNIEKNHIAKLKQCKRKLKKLLEE